MKLKDIIPYGNRFIVKKLSKEDSTKAGLILKSSANAPIKVEILAIGNGVTKVHGESEVKRLIDIFSVGDYLLIPQYANQEIMVGSETYLIVNEGDIFAHVPSES